MTTLTTDIVEKLRQRRSAGESVKTLACEIGVTWQKLDKTIRNGIRLRTNRKTIPDGTQAQETSGTGPLVERYRPRRLLDVVGQDEVVKLLCMFAARPYPAAFIFEGETGTGKTSAALALAGEIGCDLTQNPQEFGGLHVIASGEQTADTIRDIHNQLWRSTFSGSGWKVLIVNEADRMSTAAETIWLDRLEALPPKTVIVFTTNFPEKLAPRFRDRCIRMVFEADGAKLARATRQLLADIWQQETGRAVDPSSFRNLVEQATQNGQISFRRAVQLLTPLLLSNKGLPRSQAVPGLPRRSEAKTGGAL